ncbi:thiamine diphosphokinase [Rhodovulum sp. YNF3179]|uniref:thiamine diphosphokinase n=1 Tax=Rhodovulum sp. YNF3179 TaxID=3425127 RepID=UPI003D34ADB6
MFSPIVQTRRGVTLIGGARTDRDQVESAVALAPVVAAADSGALSALDLGFPPVAVIGDMDSLDELSTTRLDPSIVHRIPEQETTDFDKCLRHIAAPFILGVGFTGDRLDHQMAMFNTLVRQPGQRCIVLGADDICFHCPASLALDLPVGTRVSLFPMAPVTGRSVGLRWPIAGLAFRPDGRVGTSNATVAETVLLEMDAPGMLVMLPRAALPAAIRALTAP